MNKQADSMAAPPLTHHDIIRCATTLTRAGLKINLAACDRTARYIEFAEQRDDSLRCSIIHTLVVGEGNKQLLTRLLIHSGGLVSSLNAVVKDLDSALDRFSQIPLTRQMTVCDDFIAAYSYSLNTGGENDAAQVSLRFVCAQIGNIEMRVDTSTGGAMPADVRLLWRGIAAPYLPETLADDSDLPVDHRAAHASRLAASEHQAPPQRSIIPDDILAILGTQWRPLRFQGDHWKGVLRALGSGEKRARRAEQFVDEAAHHLASTFTASPERYQLVHRQARWQVFVRRLQPVMVFIAILALMPISWLLVSSGTVSIHPLALGLTPLLMVGVVALTAREIPVMEIPAPPAALPADSWRVTADTPPPDSADSNTAIPAKPS